MPVLEAMNMRPRVVQTLPPDGLVLEELIDGMRTEYGTPATPQEYRLIIKTLSQEELSEGVPVEPVDQARPPKPGVSSGARSSRRRRRDGRRSESGPAGGASL